MSEASNTPSVHLCPKCNGQGHVNMPPFIAGDQPTWMSNNTGGYQCPVCHGIGYVEVVLRGL